MGWYADGWELTLTATADEGYAFTGWTGCTASTATCTITMDADKSVTASFAQVYDVQVAVETFPPRSGGAGGMATAT